MEGKLHRDIKGTHTKPNNNSPRNLQVHPMCVHPSPSLHINTPTAANVLMSEDGCVKLADFGVAGQLTDTMNKRKTFVGTPFWMAPEVITQTAYDTKVSQLTRGVNGVNAANSVAVVCVNESVFGRGCDCWQRLVNTSFFT